MRGLDRYVFGQLLGPFTFFTVVFAGIIWLTQSLRVVEIVVNNNQSGLVFLELSSLLFPTVMSIVTPFAVFAATIYAVNRLYAESELVVMIAAGQSPLHLAWPIILMGFCTSVIVAFLTIYLVPEATRELRDRSLELRTELANQVLQERRFIHPTAGITVFVRETNRLGDMAGIFIHDTRDPLIPVTYTAARAQLVRTEDQLRLVMYDGAAQRFNQSDATLNILDFERIVYDLTTTLLTPTSERRLRLEEYDIFDLIDAEGVAPDQQGAVTAELHKRLSAPLYTLVLPFVALGLVLGGGYRRGGFGWRITGAVGLALGGRISGVVVENALTNQPNLWPALYIPPLAIAGFAALWLMRRPHTSRQEQRA